MEALLAEMSGKMNSGSRKRKSSSSQAAQETTVQEQDASIAAFRSWIHEPLEPEKRMQRFLADESLGTRSSDKGIVRISNLFPQEVAEGALCLMARISDWSTSSASSDKDGNKSSYGAGSTDHQFSASACLDDGRYKKDFKRMYEVIASLLPMKPHHAFQAGRYTRGHFIDAHDDAAYLDFPDNKGGNGGGKMLLHSRDIAMVYYLTKNWTVDDGGCFIDLVGGQALIPEFNTCMLFTVPRLHRVEPVLSTSVRYSIFGWFFEKGRLYDLNTDANKKKTDAGTGGGSNKKKRKKNRKAT